MTAERTFNWLHLTDLHLGMSGQDHLWPNIREAFYRDLEDLHSKCGPWHAVLFSGDLVQQGAAKEFKKLAPLLDDLWEQFRKVGSSPILLTVPGNHDLVRPSSSDPAAVILKRWQDIPEVHQEFWDNTKCAYRKVIDKAFRSYSNWRNDCSLCNSEQIHSGCLPGDFSTTLEIDGLKVGIVGLNTTFLQLSGGDYRGKLAWHIRQFHDVCGGDGAKWVNDHHVAILMTHQGPDWLDKVSRTKIYSEINPAGRFAVHLFGHMHEHYAISRSVGGGSALRIWQGSSLFGLEHFGDANEEDRRHGYSAGQITINGNAGQIRHWPRIARRYENDGWIIVPDYESCILEDDQGTRPEPVEVREVEVTGQTRPHDPMSQFAGDAPNDVGKTIANASDALQLWKEKLSYFQRELAITSDPAQKFNLRKLIEEAQSAIRSLEDSV